MTRDEAIAHIWMLNDDLAQENYRNTRAAEELAEKTREAIAALSTGTR